MALEPGDELTVAQLQAAQRQNEKIADLCQKHGEHDGAAACRSIERAILAELAARDLTKS